MQSYDAIDNYGQNALMSSIYSGNPQLFRQLSVFVPVKATDNENNSCVHIAASLGAMSILRICMEELELKDSKNLYGQTALHVAESPEIIEYLVLQSSDVNAQDVNGWTPMHYVVFKGLLDCAQLLLQIGIDLSFLNNDGLSCLDFAKSYASDLVCLLEQEKNKAHNLYKFPNQEYTNSPKKVLPNSFKKDEFSSKIHKENLIQKEASKVILSQEAEAEIIEANSEGEDFKDIKKTPPHNSLYSSELLRRGSSTDSIKSQITPKIKNMLSEYLLKTPNDSITLSDFGVEVIKYSELRLRQLLGQGAYGKVYRGYFRENEVAIKVINSDKLDDRLAKDFIKEIESLIKIRHNRFLLLLGICIEGPLCIITELSKGGNLSTAIESNTLTNDAKLKIALQIAEGIHYIHSKNPPIVHRDLKPQNILLDEYNQPKIADLGLSRAIEKVSNIEKINSTRVCAGTIRYMAPELYYEEPVCSRATDVWAYGCMIYHLFSGTPPWHGLDLIAVQRRLILKQSFICEAQVLPGIENIIKGCCVTDPELRIGLKEIKIKLLEMLGVENSQQS
jgi:tRNA A-37 threonylcarbamoyl transferase component Bud32